MTGTAPVFATRLNSFRRARGSTLSAEEAIQAVAAVKGISAVELNYPQHFGGNDNRSILAAAATARLSVTALNLRWDGPQFALGAFTHPASEIRSRAIATACDAVDVAAENGIGHVILWMGPDGYDYPFQTDYDALWDMEIAGFRAVALRNPAVRVSVEYKPSDPRRTSLIRSMSDSLLAVREVNLANFGVTLDFCHALMAGEQPAAAAALALRAGKLLGVHLNDGYGPADDGLMVGSVHPWHTLELLAELRKGGFAETIYFDTFPDRVDPAQECAANVRTVRRMLHLLDRVPLAELRAAQNGQDAVGAMRLMQDMLFGPFDD
ncbi:MAG: TIM barrel protein [Rhizobiales bacterium]|nr:TIM barrel protein [Hyphomicrobiales bacterium]MBI3672382.1 TIM barrel protein [Hyphomicrobiales bacterium]